MKIPRETSLTVLAPNTVGEYIDLADNGIKIFDDLVLDFFVDLSRLLLSDPKIKEYPELVSFGFFCRKANLIKIVRNYSKLEGFRFGKGIAFHVTPGNVPMNFAYSLLAGMLAGNVNIVRVPSKNFIEIDLLLIKLNNLLDKSEFVSLSKRILIVRYNSNSSWTKLFTTKCDIRILWGGDKTIDRIRENKLNASSTDITFYDRISACILDSRGVLKLGSLKKLASDFYIDTLFYDQNACTSTKQIFWLGDSAAIDKAKSIFWKEFHREMIRRSYSFPENSTIGKVTTIMEKLARGEPLSPINFKSSLNPLINVGFRNGIDINENDFVRAGLFFETSITALPEISKFMTKRHQTLSHFGLDKAELKDFIVSIGPNIDRIVPVGRTMDFSLTWDGYDLISTLSRSIDLV